MKITNNNNNVSYTAIYKHQAQSVCLFESFQAYNSTLEAFHCRFENSSVSFRTLDLFRRCSRPIRSSSGYSP